MELLRDVGDFVQDYYIVGRFIKTGSESYLVYAYYSV